MRQNMNIVLQVFIPLMRMKIPGFRLKSLIMIFFLSGIKGPYLRWPAQQAMQPTSPELAR